MKHFSSKNVLFIFFLVPMLSSLLSTIHLVKFAGLANPFILSILLATIVEMGAIVSFVVGSGKDLLKKIKKGYVVVMFLILFILQAFGNVYSSFDYIREQLVKDPHWLDTFMDMMLNTLDLQLSKFTVAVLLGLPIPLISLILLKSGVDYISSDEEIKQEIVVTPSINKTEEPIKVKDDQNKNNTIGQPYMS